MGLEPCRRGESDPFNLTPNNLVATGEVGTVTVTTT